MATIRTIESTIAPTHSAASLLTATTVCRSESAEPSCAASAASDVLVTFVGFAAVVDFNVRRLAGNPLNRSGLGRATRFGDSAFMVDSRRSMPEGQLDPLNATQRIELLKYLMGL